MVALPSIVVRSENIIPTLAVMDDTGQEGADLTAALAFLAVQTMFVPCAATIATMRQETKSWCRTSLLMYLRKTWAG
jgi:Fe2+ transport system protein B